MCCSSYTDADDLKQVLKTFKSAFMLPLVQKEQHKNCIFNHTPLFLCYRHLNNRNTGEKDAPNVRQPKIANKEKMLFRCSVE